MRKAKSLMTMTGTILIALLLNGCSTFSPNSPLPSQEIASQKAKKQKERQAQCNHADVLLSDLTKPAGKRVYSIHPGVVCDD